MAADVAGLRRGRARRRRRRSSSTRPGARTSASTPTCRRARCAPAPTPMLTSTHKIVGSLTQSAMLHVAARRPHRPRRGSRARVRLVRSTSPDRRCCWPRWTPPAASSSSTARRCSTRTIAASRRAARGDRRHPRLPRRRRRAWSARPGVAALGPAADRHRRPRHRLHRLRGRRRAALAAYDIQVELATHATIVLVLGLDQPVEALERFAHDFAEHRAAHRAPGRDRGGHAAPRPRSRTRSWSPPREAFLGAVGGGAGRRRDRPRLAPSRSPATRRASPRCCRASGSPPRSSTTCASCVDVGARLHGASDPTFTHRRTSCSE